MTQPNGLDYPWPIQIAGDAAGLGVMILVWWLLKRTGTPRLARVWLIVTLILGGATSVRQAFLAPSVAVRAYHGFYVLQGLVAAFYVPTIWRRKGHVRHQRPRRDSRRS